MQWKIQAALVMACMTTTAPAADLDDPAAVFGARESVRDVALSPDGGSIAYVAPGEGLATNVYSIDLDGGEGRIVATSSGNPLAMQWCEYSGAERLVCRLYGIMEDGTYRYSIFRMISMDTDGSDGQSLGQRQSIYDLYGRYYDGSVIDWLPDEDDEVLMSRVHVPEANRVNTRIVRQEEGLGVDRVDTRTGRASSVERPKEEISGYMTDQRGHVRIMWSQRRRGATFQAEDDIRSYYRTTDDDEWRELGSYNLHSRTGFQPLAIDASINAVYGLDKHDGRLALYRISLDGSDQRELVFAHGQVDVDGVVRVGRAGRIIGVTFAEDQRFTEYFDDEYKALADALSNAIPNLPLIRFAGASDDESKLLIWAGSDSDPGRYYLYDKNARTMNEIMLARPRLEGVPLASVRPIRFNAPDATAIPGYLTLPPGHESARGLPGIVMPHGGPGARDEWGFDWLAQYFAHQGYAVLQPNFRGSAGYGDDWFMINGFQSWRTAVGDVNAGGHWLIDQGVDPSQLAILGWSYGGYAALQSGVLEPGLFKAIVAIAPVTDLDLLRDMRRNYSSAAILREYLGDGPHIVQGSPAQNANRFTAPVLLFHGDRDANVHIRQSELMTNRLRDAGKDVEFVRFENLDHQLPDSDARAAMLDRSDAFLREALSLAPLDREPRSYSERRGVIDAEAGASASPGPNFPGAATPENARGVDDPED